MKKKDKKEKDNDNVFIKKVFIGWFAIIIIGILLATIYLYSYRSVDTDISNINKTDLDKPKTLIDQTPKNGVFKLLTTDNKKVFLANKEFDIDLVANSDGQIASGYDIILDYDPEIIKFLTVNNRLSGMDLNLNETDEPGRISVTTVKNTNSTDNFVFDDTILATFKFNTKKQGTFKIEINFVLGDTRESNLVIFNAEDILGKTEDYYGYIGKLVKITQNKQTIKDDIYISLKSVELPEEGCRDCLTKYTVEVVDNLQKKELNFEKGSLLGKSMIAQEAFGMIFEPTDFNQYEIMMLVADK